VGEILPDLFAIRRNAEFILQRVFVRVMTLLINDQPSTSNDDCKHFPVADLLALDDG